MSNPFLNDDDDKGGGGDGKAAPTNLSSPGSPVTPYMLSHPSNKPPVATRESNTQNTLNRSRNASGHPVNNEHNNNSYRHSSGSTISQSSGSQATIPVSGQNSTTQSLRFSSNANNNNAQSSSRGGNTIGTPVMRRNTNFQMAMAMSNGGNGDDDDDDGEWSGYKIALAVGQALFGLFAALLFIFGITGKAEMFVGNEGYDEVCTVLGSLFVFPFVFNVYTFVKSLLPTVSDQQEIRFWMIGLRVALILFYIAQCALLMLYMVTYVGSLCWIYIIPDLGLAVLMLTPTKLTSIWATLYVLIFSSKIAVFWPNLDQSNSHTNPFADRNNTLGPNGLLAICFFCIPIIQFPVLVSRLKHGMKIFEAYTVNMAAVFAHTLHFMDVLELYFLGLERMTFAEDVQYLLILFAMMGNVTCNLYYVSLFFSDDTVEKFSKRFQPSNLSVLGSHDSSADEDLIHYFVWILFFIDLPYATMRSIAWLVHGTRISVFFAKNLMMMAAVAMLLISHSRKNRNRGA